MATNAIKYLSNVGKSILYSSVDVIKDANPAITGFAETNSDVLKSSYTAITHLKDTVNKSKTAVMDSRYGEVAKKGIKNIYDDLKTGKFYNRERIDKANTESSEKMLGSMDLDFDIEMDFGNSDFDFEAESTRATIDAMDAVGEKTSTAISTVVARSAEYVVSANTQMNRAMYEQNRAIFAQLHTGMSTINSNLSTLVKLASGPIQTHLSNSTTFYETQTNLMQEQTGILKEILELQKEYYHPKKSVTSKSKKITMSDIMDSEGMPNLETYFQKVKENIKSQGAGVGAMVDFMFESGALESMIASPLQGVTNLIAKKIIPDMLTNAMKEFNASLSSVFPAMIAKLNDADETNPIMGFLKNIFGVKPQKFEGINTADYEKGRVPFDGITRKSIIEVIPTYLAKITSALTGKPEMLYDYHSGKFVETARISKVYDDTMNSVHRNASYDIRNYMTDLLYEMNLSSGDSEQFKADLEAVLQKSFKDGKLFNPASRNANAKYYGLKGGKRSDLNIELMKEIFRQMPNSMKMQWYPEMFRAKDSHYQSMQRLNEGGDSIFTAMFNNSMSKDQVSGKLKTKDNKNESAISPNNLLLNIFQEVKMIRTSVMAQHPREIDARLKYAGYRDMREMQRMNINSYMNRVRRMTPEEIQLKQEIWSNINKKSMADKYKPSANENRDPAAQAKDMVAKAKQKQEERESQYEDPKTLFDSFMQSETGSDKLKTIIEAMRGITNAPVKTIANIVKAADQALYTAIFGKESNSAEERALRDKGFLGAMHDGLKNTFSKFGKWLDEHVLTPLSNLFNTDKIKEKFHEIMEGFGIDTRSQAKNIKEKLFGVKDETGERIKEGLLSDFGDRFGGTMKEAGSYVKGTVTGALDSLEVTKKLNEKGEAKKKTNDVISDILGATAGKNGVADIDNAATGIKRVRKTGIAAVSEGEMIVPATLNPYNVAKNIKAENKAKEKFISKFGVDINIPGFAEGTRSVNFEQLSQKTKDRIDRIINSKSGISSDSLTKWINKLPEKQRNLVRDYIKDKRSDFDKDDYVSGRDKNILEKSADELLKATQSATKNIVSYMKDIAPDSVKDAAKEKDSMLSTTFTEMKKYIPEMAAGGAIGTGVSLLTGAIGGPLLGAAVGAGISLFKHSENVRKMVFGTKTADGGREGGIIPEKVTKLLEKYAPSMTKGGLLGGIASMIPGIPGGPLAGILFGSAIGFASQNEKVKNTLFGTEDKKGLLPKDMLEKVKKTLPKAGAGAIAGALIGPFGLPMNIILGSAIGFATETNTFKDIIFGKPDKDGKRSGGWLERLLDETFGRLKDAFNPIKKQFQLTAKGIGDIFKNAIKAVFRDNLGAPLDKFIKSITDPVKKTFGSVLKGILAPITWTATAPFKLIQGVGNHFRKKQIARGQDDYDTAEQRLLFRKKRRRKRGILENAFLGLADNTGIGELMGMFGPTSRFLENRDRANRFEAYDRQMIDMDSEQLSATINLLNELETARNDIDNPEYYQGLRNQFEENVQKNSSLGARQTSKIGKYMYKAMYGSKSPDDMARKMSTYVSLRRNLSDEDKKIIMDSSNKLFAGLKERNNRRDNLLANKDKIFNEIKDVYGIDITNDRDSVALIKLLERELKDRQDKEAKAKAEETTSDKIENQMEQQEIQHKETISEIKILGDKLTEIIEELKASNRHIIGEDTIASTLDEYSDISDQKLNSKFLAVRRGIRGIPSNAFIKTKDGIISAVEFYKTRKDALNEGNTGIKNAIFGNKTIDIYNPDDYYLYTGSKRIREARDKYNDLKEEKVENIKNKASEILERVSKTIPNAATGTDNVTQSGLAAVSEGESIVSAELNPSNETAEAMLEKDTILERAKKVANKAKNAIYTFVKGRPVRYIRDAAGKLMLDKSDGDTARTLDEIEEDEREEETLLSHLTGFVSGIGGSFKSLFKLGKDAEDDEESFIGSLLGKIGTAAGVAVGLPLFTGIWSEDIWPKLKPVFETIFPNLSSDLGTVFNTAMDKISNWLTGTGDSEGKGLPAVLEYLVNRWGDGFALIMEKVVPKAAEIIVASLPSIVKGVVSGIGKLLQTTIVSITRGSKPDTTPSDVADEVFGTDSSAASAAIAGIIGGASVKPLMQSTSFPTLSNWNINTSAFSTAYSATDPNFDTSQYSKEVLKAAEELGISPEEVAVTKNGTYYKNISDEERIANTEKLVNRTTLGEGILQTAGKAFLKGRTYTTLLGKAGTALSKVPNGLFKVIGSGLKAADTTITSAGKLGSRILPSNALFGVSSSTDDIAAAAAKKSSRVATIKNIASEIGEKLTSSRKYVDAWTNASGETITRAEALARGLEEGSDFVASRNILGKTIDNISAKASSTAAKMIEATDNTLVGKILNHIKTAISKLFTNNSIISKFGDAIKSLGGTMTKEAAEKAAKEFGEKISTKLGEYVSETLAKNVAKASTKLASGVLSAGVINIALGVAAFIRGYNNPNDYISVANDISEPSIFARLASGVVTALNEFCCLGLIPIDVIVDISLPLLQGIPAFSKFATEIIEDREASAELVAEKNAEWGTDLTVAEYNKVVKNRKRNSAVAKLIGQKAYINEEGEYVAATDGLIQNIGHTIFGDKETGQTHIFNNLGTAIKASWQWAIGKSEKSGAESMKDLDESDPNIGVLKVAAKATDFIVTPVRSVVNIGRALPGLISTVLESGKTVISGVINSEKTLITNAFRGNSNFLDLFDTVEDSDKKGLLGWVTVGVRSLARIFTRPIASIGMIGNTIISAVKNIVSTGKTIISNVVNSEKTLLSNAFNGNSSFSKIFDITEDNETGPLGWISTGIRGIARIFTGPIAGIGMLGSNMIDRVIDPLLDNGKTSINSITTEATRLAEYLDKDNLTGYWKNATDAGNDGIFSAIAGTINGIMRVVMFPIVAINQAFNSIMEPVQNTIENVKSGWDTITSWISGGNGSSMRGRGFRGKGFVSQLDPKYQNIRMGSESFGDAGCAPSSAYMVTDGTEKESDGLKEAASLARKYQNKDGVSPSYFGHYFKKKGLNSRYVTTSSDITDSLAHGNQVVLGGQNIRNNSKEVSPFGPGGHYVVANGITSDRKYMSINDPESSTPNKFYPTREILKSTKVGIAAGRGSGILYRGRGGFRGRGTLPGSDTAEKVWNFLRSNGFTEEATAGVMGNFKRESGMDPTILQNGRGPAAGIYQLEKYGDYSSRWGAMAKYAESKGCKWTDLQCQLEFLLSELPSTFKTYTGKSRHYYPSGDWCWWPTKMTSEEFKKLTDIALATEIFERVVERGSIVKLSQRIQYAKEYYNRFSGKYTTVDGTATSDSSSSGAITSTASTVGTTLDKILGFADNLAVAYGLSATPASSGSSSSSSTSATSSSGSYSYTGSNVSSNPEYAEKQKALVAMMKSKEGQLLYSQKNRNPDTGSGDCSSTVQWAYKNVLNVDPGSWTGAQRTDSDTYTAATSTQDESKLQLGDLLLKSGHVEMYMGDGKMIGHGGGPNGTTKGPVVSTLNQKPGVYNLVRRWIGFRGTGSRLNDPDNTGSDTGFGNITVPIFEGKASGNSIVRYGKGSSATNSKLSTSTTMLYKGNTVSSVPISSKTSTSSGSSYSWISSGSNSASTTGSTSTVNYTTELLNIVSLLTRVVDNTSLLQSIVSILTELLQIMSEESDARNSNDTNRLNQLQVQKQNLFTSLGNMASNSGNDQISQLIKNAEKLARA